MGKRRRSLSLVANLMRDMGMTDVSLASELAAEIVTQRLHPSPLSPFQIRPNYVFVPRTGDIGIDTETDRITYIDMAHSFLPRMAAQAEGCDAAGPHGESEDSEESTVKRILVASAQPCIVMHIVSNK